MGPSRPLRLVARDRARRNPLGRPDYVQIHPGYLQIHKVKTWWDAQRASPLDAGPTVGNDAGASEPKRDPVSRIFLIAIAAVAVNCGAGLGLVGWGALQSLGWVDEPAIETVQRQQTALISQLEETVHGLSAAVAGLSARVYSAGDREDALSRRMAEIDAAIGVLRTGMNQMRAAQNAAQESWREPFAELTAAAEKASGEIARLRASLDELSRARHPEVVAINTRIDRIEKAMAQHNLLGPLRGSIQEPGTGRVSLPPENSPAADGHIINLAPAH
jgi:hypothetical protein